MKTIILILSAVFIASVSQAQPFQQGTTAINAGVGIGTALGGTGHARAAISISLDHGSWSFGGPGVVSMCGYVANTGYKYTSAGYTAKWSYFFATAPGDYPYNGFASVPTLDV